METQTTLELDPRDAVRAMAAAYDGSLLGDDHDLEDLFGAGVLRTVRDISDEYVTELTREGRAAIYALLDRLDPENRVHNETTSASRHGNEEQ